MNTDPVTVYAWRNEPQSDLRSLTAASLLGKIELAEGGDTRELFALYRDLVASDNQLQMELENRKRAVLGDTATLLPFDKKQEADLAAKETCFPLLDSAPFETAKNWLLNAVLWPVAVCEKVYAPAHGGYALAQIVPVPYQLLDYREGTLRIFDTDERGTALPTSHAPDPARYIVHRGHTLPLPDNWGGPMRSILFWILLRSMSRQWWADLLERFGMPFLKGKYSDEKGKTVLQHAFAIAQRLGGIVVHKNTEVEIVQAAAGDSSGSHERFIELCNKEISKLVAGQTLSSNAQPTGLGNGATPLQGAVRDDIRKSDCQRLAATLRTQLLAQFCRINAVPGRVPLLVFGSDSAAEMQALIGTVASLAAAGLEPDDDGLAALSERVGFGLRRKSAPAAAQPFPFHAVPLAADSTVPGGGGAAREPAGKDTGTEPEDPLAEIVRTSSSSTECLRRVRAHLEGRPLDEQAEELAAAMDSYAAKALLRARTKPLSVDANGAHHGDHSGRFVSEGGENDDAGNPDDGHTPEEKKRIEEYQDASDPKAAEYYRVAQTLEGDALKNAPPFVFAESCPQRMADEIKKQTGIDATGYPVKVDVGHARHTEIRHGEHGKADHSMDPESFARTRYVLDHFETCEPAMKNGKPHLNDNYRNSENKPSPQLQFRMRIDGQAVVQEAVQDAKNKVVWIVSSFREPSAAEKEAKVARRAFFREWGKKKASQGKS